MQSVTLAERPDLAGAAFGFGYPDAGGAVFMQANMVSSLTSARRLAALWPAFVVVLLEGDVPVARAVAVPFASRLVARDRFPDGGWDQIAIWAAEDILDGRAPDTVCALEIAVEETRRGRGLAAAALDAMTGNARAQGFDRLIAPIRPPGKADEPFESIDTYLHHQRGDGLSQDWWIRLHERGGGRLAGIARCSATVQAPLAEWRRWTGLSFDGDGEVAVSGGLVPVLVSTQHDLGVYVEPNVWFEYTLVP